MKLITLISIIILLELDSLLSISVLPINRPYVLFDTGNPPDAFGVDGFDIWKN